MAADCFYYELKLNRSQETERFECRYRFRVVPHYDQAGIQRILEEYNDDVEKWRAALETSQFQWTEEGNYELVRFIQNLSALHSCSPSTMTVGYVMTPAEHLLQERVLLPRAPPAPSPLPPVLSSAARVLRAPGLLLESAELGRGSALLGGRGRFLLPALHLCALN